MIGEDGRIGVTCEFCGTHRDFDPAGLRPDQPDRGGFCPATFAHPRLTLRGHPDKTVFPCSTISSSSAPARAAMCAPSGRPNSASRSRSSRSARPTGGPASTSAAFPSKALLYATEMFEAAGHEFAPLGIVTSKPELDWTAMGKHRDDTVASNVNGVAFLFKKNKVETFHGSGRIKGAGSGRGDGRGWPDHADARDKGHRDRDRLGCGAPAWRFAIDEKVVVSSTGALALDGVPQKHHRYRGRGDRAGARLRMAAPRRRRDGDRISRPHPARHGCRGGQAVRSACSPSRA